MNGKWIYSLATILKWKVVSNIQFLLFGLLLHLTKTEVIHGATEHKKVSVKSQQTDSQPSFSKAGKVLVISL